MIRYSILFFILLQSPSFAQAQENPPRLLVLDAKVLDANKKKVIGKDESVMPAYRQLLKDADAALRQQPLNVMEKKPVAPSGDKHDYMSLAPYYWPDPAKPNGLPYIRKDGQTNPEVKEYTDKDHLPKMAGLVQTLAQAWYFSNKEMYAMQAARLLRSWFLDPATKMNPNFNYAQAIKGVNDGRGAGMIDARVFIRLMDAIQLLQGSGQWTRDDQAGMKKWFSEFLNWMQTSKNGIDESDAPNNHGTWYDALRLSLALFTGKGREDAIKIISSAKGRLDRQMDELGSFPKEMERTISLHYSAFNLQAFFLIAAMAEHIGIDLWNYVSPKGNSLRKGFMTLKPYLTNEKSWPGQQIKPFDFEEDAYPLLVMAAAGMDCRDCKAALLKLPGKKENPLILDLLY